MMELAAVLFGTLNKPLEAERVYLRVLEIQPHVPTAYQRLIFYYAVTMQRTKMQKQIERCISTECDSPETYVYRLLVGSDWNAFSNAHELLGQWLKSDPDNEFFQVAYALHVVKAHSLEDKMMADKNALATATDESSIRAREFGERISDLISRFPSNIELLVFMLNQATANGDIDQVAKLLSRAPPEAISDNRFWRYKGWFHAAQSELVKAEDAFREALKLNPYDWGSRHQLAEVMRRTKRLKEAEFSEQLSVQGKELREEIVKLPDVRSAPPRMLKKILDYAAACGDSLVAEHLYRRLQSRGPELPHF
jgi:tetratricopeptide (TPR) repeat protein